MKTITAEEIIDALSKFRPSQLTKVRVLGADDEGILWSASYVWDDNEPIELFCDTHKSISGKKLLDVAKKLDPKAEFVARFGDGGDLRTIKVAAVSLAKGTIRFESTGRYKSSKKESLFKTIYNTAKKLEESDE